MTIRIETLSDEHIESLVKFKLDQQMEMHSNITWETFSELEHAERQFLYNHMNKDLYMYGLFEEEALVAISGMHIYESSPGTMSMNGLLAYICNVYTLPQFRKRGYQNQLLEHCISIAEERQIRMMFLGTSNPIAADFYNKHDFQVNKMLLVRYK